MPPGENLQNRVAALRSSNNRSALKSSGCILTFRQWLQWLIPVPPVLPCLGSDALGVGRTRFRSLPSFCGVTPYQDGEEKWKNAI